MRVFFGLLGLVVALASVGVLIKHQLAPQRLVPQVVPADAAAAPGGQAPTVRQQAQDVQRQYKQALESALQQPRDLPDDAK